MMSPLDLARINAEMGHDAQGLTRWALGLGQRAIVTTNFRPFEAVILHLVTQVQPDVPVVWMDNGYNTEATYRYADEVTKQLGLNLKIYLPLRSRAHREAVDGPTPALDDPRHAAFTRSNAPANVFFTFALAPSNRSDMPAASASRAAPASRVPSVIFSRISAPVMPI